MGHYEQDENTSQQENNVHQENNPYQENISRQEPAKSLEDLYEEVRAWHRKTLKLHTRNWLSDIADPSEDTTIVEVRFKNTRKAFYDNQQRLNLREGDVVAVEAPTGHDIGIVSLTGYLAKKQFNRKIRRKKRYDFLTIYRKARAADIDKWREAKKREIPVRNRARVVAREQGLDMKISDVEVQGDNTKAIFYYLADGRVDFRELIRIYAREFHLKVEMRQIGARQEAAMIGALDTSGRELCGSAWKTNFESVKISAARIQQLPSNTEKLTGHCGKLKSSLMYELDTYLEAWKGFPDKLPVLETASGKLYPQKTDVLQRKVWYSASPDSIMNPVEVSLEHMLEIQRENRKGNKPPLDAPDSSAMEQPRSFTSGTSDILEKNSSSRKPSSSKKPSSFKKPSSPKKKKKKKRKRIT
ncbi:MAG: hypothetical protein KGY60_11325 [Bacteroidales bacterium]|nr:hypothetical protein [Bacteroidales bacterium]